MHIIQYKTGTYNTGNNKVTTNNIALFIILTIASSLFGSSTWAQVPGRGEVNGNPYGLPSLTPTIVNNMSCTYFPSRAVFVPNLPSPPRTYSSHDNLL
jgi:hypothetical protein